MNPFQVLDEVQQVYHKYVESFQLIASPDIPPMLKKAIESGEPPQERLDFRGSEIEEPT